MSEPTFDTVKFIVGIITAFFGLANTIILTLGMFILRSISKKGEENGADIRRAHQRIDEIESKRQTAWIEKEKDCGEEKAAREELRTRVKHLEK